MVLYLVPYYMQKVHFLISVNGHSLLSFKYNDSSSLKLQLTVFNHLVPFFFSGSVIGTITNVIRQVQEVTKIPNDLLVQIS